MAALRILVTGGAGFLGSHLIDRLLARGHHVICLDNFHTGSRENLSHHHNNPRLEIIARDVCLPLDMAVDEIYNLACPASPVHYQEDPIATFKTCVLGAITVLDLAQRTGAKIFQASTSEIYGDAEVHPQPEDYWGNVNPRGIRSCYDEGKRGAETLFFDYQRQHGLDIRVARIFNTYGPRMHPEDGRVVSNFIVQALKGENITVYGDGSQTRSFCYCDDLVSGFLSLMDHDGELDGPINLGNDQEFTIAELGEIVLRLTGSESKVSYLPLPGDDPQQRQPVLAKARDVLGWSPQVLLEDGLKSTITYFKQKLAA